MADSSDSPAALAGARRRQRTRTAVLDAAERLLSKRGADEIRIVDIAEEAGLSSASVYVHFGTKDDLVVAVIERILDSAAETLEGVCNGDGSPLERIRTTGRLYRRLLLEHPPLTRYLCIGGLREKQSTPAKLVAERLEALRIKFEECIQAAVDAGEIRPLDSRLLSFFLFGAWNGVADLALRTDGTRLTPAEAETALRQGARLLEEGMVTH